MNTPPADAVSNAAPPSAATPFHPGEQAVQTAAGVRAEAEARGQRMLTSTMVDAQRQFFTELPYVVAARIDASGQPWAEFVTGAPGFISFAADGSVRIDRGRPALASPFAASYLAVQPGHELGLLGIDLARRRRNRINGTVEAVSVGAIELRVEQGYGNCPKYISQRPWNAGLFAGDYLQQLSANISPAVAAMIARSDTFFIASSSGPAAVGDSIQPTAWGADISHRGGEPGFLQVDGNLLHFADYPGNNLFNTLGNLQRQPRCGLLLLDFDSGEVVQIAGRAALNWDANAQRYSVAADVTAVRHWSKVL
jgi:predicted pyridoxine 5'-phosphate oxidase superfamily flavin-nucleotide-binding protein